MMDGFYTLWTYLRWIAVGLSIALFIALTVYCHAWSLEFEYVGPGSECDRLDRDSRDHENRDSFDRVQEGKGDSRDVERAGEYTKDREV